MKASKDMLLREIAGEVLLIPTGETALRIHGMISLTESGGLLWKAIEEKDCNEDDLVKVILGVYNIDEATARSDVQAFIKKMKTLGIIEE